MIRLGYVIIISLPFVIYYMVKSNYVLHHMERFTELQRYRMVRHMIAIMKKNGRIVTDVYGTKNLPKEGGYVMYCNHQGKYDALGVIGAHKEPCTFVMDKERSRLPFAREVLGLLEGAALDKKDTHQQIRMIVQIIKQVQAGRRYIIFPEGGYEDNGNLLHEFKPGTFKCSVRSKTPIVPVALRDSYRVFGINSLKKVRTEVHFLKPIDYIEYEEMTTTEIARTVQNRIQTVIDNKTA